MFQNMENIEKLKKFSDDLKVYESFKETVFEKVNARDSCAVRSRGNMFMVAPLILLPDTYTCSFKLGSNYYVPYVSTNDTGVNNIFNNMDAANQPVGYYRTLGSPMAYNTTNWPALGTTGVMLVKATKPSTGEGTWYIVCGMMSSSTQNQTKTLNYTLYVPHFMNFCLYADDMVKIPSI